MDSPHQLNATNVLASVLGTNKTMTVKLFGGETTSDVSTLIETVTIDVSALTIQPFENNIVTTDSGISITPSTYSTTKTVTGEVPYDTQSNKNLLNVSCSYNCNPSRSYYVIQVVNSSNSIIYNSGNIATGSLPNPNSFSIPITNNEIGVGEYITVNMYTRANQSGTLYPLGQSIVLDTSALTLETSPTMTPYLDFADSITYNNITYTQSDFTSTLGTITRNSNNNYITIDGAIFKRVSLDGGTTYGYYFLYTSLDNGAQTYDGRNIIGASMWSSIGGKSLVQPSMDSVPQKGLFQIGDVWSTPTGSNITIKTPTGNISASVIFQNCTFENKGSTPAGRDDIYVDYSGFTYNNVNYNASDFITGGTITRGSNDNYITITGATLKWNPLQGETTNAYYVPLIKNNSGQMISSIGGTKVYAPIAKVQAKSNITGNMGNFINGTGSDVFVIKINSTASSFNNYPIIIQNIYESGSYASVNLKLENCTFEPAP